MKKLFFSFLIIGSASVYAQQIDFELFTPNAPLENVVSGFVSFADIDNDGDQDLIVTGMGSSYQNISKLYINDGAGNYTVVANTPFEGAVNSSVAFSDVNGDGFVDVIIAGMNNSYSPKTNLYLNDANGNFVLDVNNIFPGIYSGSIAFADIDNDGDDDLLISGNNITKLYKNDGAGVFTEVTGSPFPGLQYGASLAFSDTDGDGDLDVLIVGGASGTAIAKLYSNDGTGLFTEVIGTSFEGVSEAFISFADVNGDTFEDVLITGKNGSSNEVSKLYLNDGTGLFTEVTGTPFENVKSGSFTFVDMDFDGDLDLLITGKNMTGEGVAKAYENDGQGVFTALAGLPFIGALSSSIAFADIDGDGDQDVLITGSNSLGQAASRFYKNIFQCTVPIANTAVLDGITSVCEITTLPAPTATSNCAGLIEGVPDVTFPITASGTTTVTWTYDDGNGMTSSQTQLVIINPINKGVTQTSASTWIANASGYTYQWVDCDNNNSPVTQADGTSQSFSPETSGNYAVIISNNECSVTSDCIQMTISSLGVTDHVSTTFKLFPNPTEGNVNVEFISTQAFIQVEVLDVTGRVVNTINVTATNSIQLQLKGESGIYHLRISTPETIYVQKVNLK